MNKRELELIGLDCANCAMKIEDSVSKLEYVKKSNLNFPTQKLTIEVEDPSSMFEIIESTKKIVLDLEPHVVVNDLTMKKYEYQVEGLHCANCATKIEETLNNRDDITYASLDFVSQKLRVESNNPNISLELSTIVDDIEPGVTLNDVEKQLENHGNSKRLIRLIISLMLFGFGFIFEDSLLRTIYWLFTYLFAGRHVLLRAFSNIRKGKVFDENFLMAIATIGAMSIGEFSEGVAVMIFYEIGEYFQELAVNRSRKSISSLLNIRPDYANLIDGDKTVKVAPEQVKVGDVIVVKAGEKVPLDGNIIEGTSTLDISAITGESLPKEVSVNDEILSGSINNNGLLYIKVTKVFGESTVSKILDLVQNASGNKAPTERFITKFAYYYTPIVVLVALGIAIIPPVFIQGALFSDWLYRSLIFLVVSCPCALVISIPLGFFGGIGAASKHGILFKGSNFLEALNQVEYVVLDKTGTLTKGEFIVSKIVGDKNLLELAGYAEYHSNHPIAKSIVKSFDGELDSSLLSDYFEIAGHGISVQYHGLELLAGNHKLMEKYQIDYPEVNEVGTIIYVAYDSKYIGYLLIEDEIKEESYRLVKELKSHNITHTVMLTGDRNEVAKKVAENLGISEVYSELLPHEKVEQLEKIRTKSNGKVVFVGDGINDAPVLTLADVGIAMGGVGSDAAIEACDVVIMTDEITKIASAIHLAKETRKVVWQNIIFAFGVKGIVLLLGAMGLATMWEAVFADVGVALIAVLNAMRILKK